MWPLTAALRKHAAVKRTGCQLTLVISEASIVLAGVVHSIASCQGLRGGADDSSAFGIEHPAHPHHAALAGLDREGAGLDALRFCRRISLGVGCVAHVVTEVDEAADAQLARLVEQRRLVEGLVGPRLLDRRRRARDVR